MLDGMPNEATKDVNDNSTILQFLIKEKKKEFQRVMNINLRHNQRIISILFNHMNESIEQSIIDFQKVKKAMKYLKLQYFDTNFTIKHSTKQKLI